MLKLRDYIQWICKAKKLWSLEHFYIKKKCYYRKKNKFGEIPCRNANCNGYFPDQEQRRILLARRYIID